MFYLCVIYASPMFSFGPQTTVEIWFEHPVSDKDYHHLGPQTGPLLKYQQQWGCSLAFKCLVSRGEKSRKRFRPYTWPRATEHFQSQNWSWKLINLATSLSKNATSNIPACLPVLYGANLPPKCTTPWMNIQSFSFLAAKILWNHGAPSQNCCLRVSLVRTRKK